MHTLKSAMFRLAVVFCVTVLSVSLFSCNDAPETEKQAGAGVEKNTPAEKPKAAEPTGDVDITGYADYKFGTPFEGEFADGCLSMDDEGGFTMHVDPSHKEKFMVPGYEVPISANLSMCTIDTTEGEGEDQTTFDSIETSILFFELDKLNPAAGDEPEPKEVAEFFYKTMKEKYDKSVLEKDERDGDNIHMFFRDADNDTIWLDYTVDPLELTIGYKSARMRVLTDKMKEEMAENTGKL